MGIKSQKSAVAALLLCIFFGAFGVHRFYVGKIGTGILMLLTGGGFGIWVLIDIVRIACEEFTDKDGNTLEFEHKPGGFKKAMMVLLSIVATLFLFIVLIILIAFYMTRGLIQPIQFQLAALRAGNMTQAYSYTSKDFQNTTTLEKFENFINRYPSLKNNESASFPLREFENGEGKVKGILKAKDGAITPIEYRLVRENGSWKILGLQVRPTGAGTQIMDKETTTPTAPAEALSNVFDDPKNKFTIKYPATWVYELPTKQKVIFSGKKGTSSFDSVINIQTVPSKQAGGVFKNSQAVLDDMKKQIKDKASNIVVLGEGPVTLMQSGKKLDVRTYVFNYTLKDQDFKQMLIIVPKLDNTGFYIWTFNSTKNQYDVDLPIAKAMFESWSIR